MKKLYALLILTAFLSTGCLKRDNLEDISIYTTVYPIEYITDRLYGKHSNIYSIYPDGVNINNYELSEKLLKDYSKASIVIFNGLNKEKDYVISMYKNNKKIKIIDSTLSMEFVNNYEEMWLDPLNFLMMTQNIRTGFRQYITNHYLKNEIDEKYEELKLEISNLDAKIKLMVENANDKTIVVSSDLFKFLKKYNLNVISLEENDNLSEKTIAEVKSLINKNKIKYIYLKKNENTNETIKKLIEGTDVKLLYLHPLTTLSEEERKTNEDYISLMNGNIELLKQEVYE
ncbi:MAG: metal ABC transporter substrate-binding protein [Bacilli bacterium]